MSNDLILSIVNILKSFESKEQNELVNQCKELNLEFNKYNPLPSLQINLIKQTRNILNNPIYMQEFMTWANGVVNVVWLQGCLTVSKPLKYFKPQSNEGILDFLDRILDQKIGYYNGEVTTPSISIFNDRFPESSSLWKNYMETDASCAEELVAIWLILRGEEKFASSANDLAS
jgi:hypothetical protein